MKTCAGGEGERINLRRKNEEEDKQKAGRKKRRKMGKEENLVGRLIRWGRGRRFFFIEKKNREEPGVGGSGKHFRYGFFEYFLWILPCYHWSLSSHPAT